MFLTPAQLAARWSCSASHIRRLCRTGELPAMRLGTDKWRVSLDAVTAYEQRQSTAPVESAPPASTPRREAAQPTTAGFVLPADYVPVFPDLWSGHQKRRAADTTRR